MSLLKYSPHLKGRGILGYGSCLDQFSVLCRIESAELLLFFLSCIFLFAFLIGDGSREEQGWGDFARMHKTMQRGL